MFVVSMIALTQKAKYALKALAHLAQRWDDAAGDQPATIVTTIATAESIPRKFLEAILVELRNHGFVHARKGRGGGYWLARPPSQIHVGAVVRIFEGPLAPIPCVSKRYYAKCQDCRDERDCDVRRLMLDVKKAILGVLDRTSLQQMVDRAGEPIEL